MYLGVDFKENDPHVDIEARMMPALTAGGVTHRLNRGGYLTTPETSAPIHDIGYPGRSEQPVRVFALGEAKNASRKRSYAAVELPSNNEIERPKKRRRNQKSNSSSGAPAPPAVAPRPARAASNSVSLLSDALANLSITQGGPTATQSIANPNNRLASPENFMAAIKSTIETKNPPAAATSAGVPVVPFPPATEKAFPLSSTKPKPAARREPDRGRHTFEGRLLGTQQSKYAPKNVPVDTDVTMTDGDDDVPVAPAASASDKPRTGLMASKWAPKKA